MKGLFDFCCHAGAVGSTGVCRENSTVTISASRHRESTQIPPARSEMSYTDRAAR